MELKKETKRIVRNVVFNTIVRRNGMVFMYLPCSGNVLVIEGKTEQEMELKEFGEWLDSKII